MARQVIAVVADLFFASKIRAAAEELGISVRFARNVQSLLNTAQESAPDLILVDLQSTNPDAIVLAETIRTDATLHSVPLLGFYSHVLTELQERAKAAGYNYVMPRSAFSSKLGQILSGEL